MSAERPHVRIGKGSVVAKMVCLKLEQVHGQKGGTIRLSPVTGNSLENKEFWRYTPSGTFEFNSINPAAFEYFRLGEEYRVVITHVPEVERLRGELEFLEAEIVSLREKGETLGAWRVGSPEQVAREISEREKLAAPLRDAIRRMEGGTFPA
ncbi:MAG: hypothetical protein B7Z78_13435 [Rhodospirillales bacterium 20-60-12]|nr:MAG: hypothetical protein B7Z78_13435 [Rhodospirillales bacterium 20-60-12]